MAVTSSPASPPVTAAPWPAEPAALRVLLVGPPAFTAPLAAQTARALPGCRVEQVETYLMALGHAAADPPHLVLGRLAELHEEAGSVATGMKHLAPAARLVLLAGAGEERAARQACEAGFDGVAPCPAGDEDLGRLISALRESAAEPAAPATAGADLAAHAPEPPQTPVPPETSDAPQALSPWQVAEAPAELGDIDLVEHLLHERQGFAHLAVELIRQRLEEPDLHWAPAAEAVAAPRSQAAVNYDGQAYGVLHAPMRIERASLEPWAAWLGRWMALHTRVERLEQLSFTDELTGVSNRRHFNNRLRELLDQARRQGLRVTLLVFDIDDFKHYNDRYGHPAGDEILRETARLIRSMVRTHDVVARIGGDEFAVIFWDAEEPRRQNSRHPRDVCRAARRFQKAILEHRFPKLLDRLDQTLTISGGLAAFPWDGTTADELLTFADRMALQSKARGKNAITFGPGAQRLAEQFKEE